MTHKCCHASCLIMALLFEYHKCNTLICAYPISKIVNGLHKVMITTQGKKKCSSLQPHNLTSYKIECVINYS